MDSDPPPYSVGRTAPRAPVAKILDLPFLFSVPAVLLALQSVFCFLGMVVASSWYGGSFAARSFFIFIMFVAFISSLSLLATRAIKLHDLIKRDIPWEYVMAGYSAVAMFFVLIASSVMVEKALAVSSLKAAGIFGLFAWNALVVGCVVHGRDAYLRYRQYSLPTAQAAEVHSAQSSRHQSPNSDFSSSPSRDTSHPPQRGDYIMHEVPLPVKPPSYDVVTPSEIANSKRSSAIYSPTTETWQPS